MTMMWIHPAVALLMAALLAVVLVQALQWRHPQHSAAGPSLLLLIVMLFPLFWALAAWVAPRGPSLYGAYVLPFLGLALLVTLVIAILRAPAPPPEEEREEAAATATAFGIAFWLLMVASAAMIVIAYVT